MKKYFTSYFKGVWNVKKRNKCINKYIDCFINNKIFDIKNINNKIFDKWSLSPDKKL